ncbi:MAG: ATP-binding cassette domain-containing protein [Pseudomonadota bacterium]
MSTSEQSSLDQLRLRMKRASGAQSGAESAAQSGVRPATGAPVPGAGNLLSQIDRVARAWGDAPPGAAPDGGQGSPTDVPPPEALSEAIRHLGVDVHYEERRLASLKPADFPCIILLRDGSSLTLIGRPNRAQIEADIGGNARTFEIEDLAGRYAGTVFFIAPSKTAETRERDLETSLGRSQNGRRLADTGAAQRAGAANVGADPLDILKVILNHMRADRPKLFSQLIAAAIISNLFVMALPLFTMAVYDRVIPHLAMETLWALSMGVLLVLCVDMGLRFVRLKIVDALALSSSLHFQARIFRNVTGAPLENAPRSAGGLAGGLRDLDALCQTAPSLFVALAIDMPFFLFLVGFLIYLGGFVFLAPLAGLLVLVALHIISRSRALAASRATAENQMRQANMMIDSIIALETIKSSGAETMLLRRWERLSDEVGIGAHNARLWSALTGQTTVVVVQAVIVMVMVLGVYGISSGALTVGGLAAATLIVGRAISPVGQMVSLLDRTSQLSQSSSLLVNLLNMSTERGGDIHQATRPIKGGFQLTNVTFRHRNANQAALTGLSLAIKPGERIGLIGRIGSGKSTLMRLLLRFYDATDGRVLLDGMDIRQLSPEHLRRGFGFLAQDPALLDLSLRDNICFGQEAVDPTLFEQAAAISGTRDIAAGHADGYGLRVGPRGEALSGGERQAVALGRALLAGRQGLILDEPTAAMDTTLEARVVRDLAGFIGERTFIVATHRAPLLDLVDRIIWLDNGRLVADGPRAEIMAKITSRAA